ncbi:MAG: UTP--glucose-1-phosphate uridylyltransferase [Desulfobacterales bacterium]|nr:UTP--glucose-1-phosphate uridylyltransferase [Desulfobacterales bacterium]MDD4071250.1 UTP--glucose-1-phosphate uridylyltransferase [Desulfobacterales bacterium]MDD4393274.1 UTP--glucose-1-phosphate uridylyltransferase [Desulfobacterales bacterium]
MNHLPSFIKKMDIEGLPKVAIDTFAYYYKKLVSGSTGLVYDKDIRPVDPDEIETSGHLKPYADYGNQMLGHAVMLVLNGGLGTSMGLTRAKSLLKIKNGYSFLEIITKQAEADHVKLAFMNSFSTHDDTMAALKAIHPEEFPLLFMQHKFPKILQDNLSPALCPKNPSLEWNPPGHGDIYTAMVTSGILDFLLSQGITYAFISNSDNLGATMDTSLLGYFAEKQLPFMMEVAERTPADAKGGHLARHRNGRLLLRESAQCPDEEIEAFKNICRYRFFNTNNIWINLQFLKQLTQTRQTIELPMIVNPKTIDPRDMNSPKVFQIETAMGSAISLFEGSIAVKVPRSRFFPVKKCDDLLTVRSDCFQLTENFQLIMNPDRLFDLPKLSLDPRYYGKIDDLNARFQFSTPSLIECESLSIKGDVFFEDQVSIKGRVRIKNTKNTAGVVKEGTIIDHDMIF